MALTKTKMSKPSRETVDRRLVLQRKADFSLAKYNLINPSETKVDCARMQLQVSDLYALYLCRLPFLDTRTEHRQMLVVELSLNKNQLKPKTHSRIMFFNQISIGIHFFGMFKDYFEHANQRQRNNCAYHPPDG